MYVRLAFAVAAFLDPEILIVDEVLAVGDAEFQKKCLGRMKDVSTNDGRTVLFVSHNMGAVASLCSKAMVLANGSAVFNGNTKQGIDFYLNSADTIKNIFFLNEEPKASDILDIKIVNEENGLSGIFSLKEEVKLLFKLQLEEKYKKAFLGFRIIDQAERNVFTSEIDLQTIFDEPGLYHLQTVIPAHTLVPNRYTVLVAMHIPNVEFISLIEDKLAFEIEDTGSRFSQYTGTDYGCVFVECKWNKINQVTV
jgi:lipopolysaccharide transport system ATP-binding protein